MVYRVVRQVMYSKPEALGEFESELLALRFIVDRMVSEGGAENVGPIGRDKDGQLYVHGNHISSWFHVEPRECYTLPVREKIEDHIRIEISGPMAVGKTFLMRALGIYLADQGYSVAVRDGGTGVAEACPSGQPLMMFDTTIAKTKSVLIETQQ